MTLLVHHLSGRVVTFNETRKRGVLICFSVVLLTYSACGRRGLREGGDVRSLAGAGPIWLGASPTNLVDYLVDGGLLVARPGHDVLIVGRDITA